MERRAFLFPEAAAGEVLFLRGEEGQASTPTWLFLLLTEKVQGTSGHPPAFLTADLSGLLSLSRE